MSSLIGYKRDTLENFYAWQGTNGSPAEGTVNQRLGFSTNNEDGTTRYTFPIIHKDSTCEYDAYGMPIVGTIQGSITDVIFVIDDKCPQDLIPDGLMTKEEFDALEWVKTRIE